MLVGRREKERTQCEIIGQNLVMGFDKKEHDSQRKENDDKKSGNCNHGGKPGHWKNECCKKILEEGKCFHCKKHGHMERDCMNKGRGKTRGNVAQEIGGGNVDSNSTHE